MNQVLLVGEAVGRLEVDLVPWGLSCVGVATATAAVEAMKQHAWSAVVVGVALPDMSGPAFVDGLMRHFDPLSVVLVANVEPHIAQHLTSSPKVQIFPAATPGNVVAEHLFRRLGGKPGATPPSPPVAPGNGGFAGNLLAGLIDAPSAPSAPSASSAPPPATAFIALSPPMSFPPAAAPAAWGAPAGQPRPPTVTTMPFFAALGQSAAPAAPSPSPSSTPTGADRAAWQRIEALTGELASANAEMSSLRARAQLAEARAFDAAQKAFEREAQSAVVAAELGELKTELEIVRHAGRAEAENAQQVLVELYAARQGFEALQAEVEPLRAVAAVLEQAVADLAGLRAAVQERDRAIEDARQVVEQVSAQHHADVAALNARVVQLGEELVAREATANARGAECQALREAMQGAEEAHAAALAEARAAAQLELDAVRALLARASAGAAEVEPLRAQVAGLEATAAEVESLRARIADLEAAVAEMESLRAAKLESEAAWAQDQQQVQALEVRLTAAEARVIDEQARIVELQAEVERQELRLDAAALATVDLQRQLEAALGTEEGHGDTGAAIQEAVRARTREVLELARAIEPFSWGLGQAATFFSDVNVEGAQRHIQSLRLLQKTLEKLKLELDRVH